jgi:hypothetical protein
MRRKLAEERKDAYEGEEARDIMTAANDTLQKTEKINKFSVYGEDMTIIFECCRTNTTLFLLKILFL